MSFLFGQIMRASHVPFESALSKDKIFMAAIEDLEKQFLKSYGN